MNSPTPLRQAVTGEIRAELARQRKTLDDLASGADLALSTLKTRMSTRTAFTLDELERIAAALGVPVINLWPTIDDRAAS